MIQRPARNVTRLLGTLEAEIMEILWRTGEATVREVVDELAQRRPIAYTTVMTVMGRLVEKELLRRTRDGPGYRYQPTSTKETFLEQASQRIVEDLVADLGEVAIAKFVEVLERVDPDRLAALAGLSRRRGAAGR